MWLEMWAYISDVLGFYDERTANETYIRTSVRRPSLRRIVQLLGYTPSSGVAASAKVAAIADGSIPVNLPPATGFRSSAFGKESPQVFETTVPWTIHPLKNQWKVTSFKRRPTLDAAPSAIDGGNVRTLLFETQGFGLAKNEMVLFESRETTVSPVDPPVSLVTATDSIEGRDSLTYVRVTLQPAVTIDGETDLSQLRARRPTQSATPTVNEPVDTEGGNTAPPPVGNLPDSGGTRVYLDLGPASFRQSDPIIAVLNLGSPEAQYALTTVSSVKAASVTVTGIPPQQLSIPQPDDEPDLVVPIPSPTVPATELILQPELAEDFVDNPDKLTFLYTFVDGGQPTNAGKTEIGVEDLADSDGIPLDGIIEPPPEAIEAAAGLAETGVIGELEQEFLISDGAQSGAVVDGRIEFTSDGRATFFALSPEQLLTSKLRLPLTIYGNVIDTTRGQSVFGEVLGNGNARVPSQRFKLRKKPLTYLASTGSNTLEIRVDGVLWSEVVSFFGRGPEDTVYTVRHDDEQNTFVTFGDGVRGARLPSGVKNVVANYRFGAGAAAPPAGSINQLAGAVKGLRAVRSPIAAEAGKDPDQPEELRTNAPLTALLFGRAVSAADFEALARQQPGIVQAKAEWLWIQSQMQAGVVVQYIGTADPATIAAVLTAQADPTIPLEVTQAEAIPTTVSLGVEVDSRFVKETVAAEVLAFLIAPGTGVLSLEQARIGGTFWPSILYEAVSQVKGVVAVSGVTFLTSTGTPQISNSRGTCIETGKYLDFSAPGSVTVTGVAQS
jgi:hypothetical protein